MSNTHKIAAVILNYTAKSIPDTQECLESLKLTDLENIDFKVFLINFGDDLVTLQKTADQLKSLYSEIEIIHSEANLGFAKANNLGINAALNWGAEYVLLLNNDTIVSVDFLQLLTRYLEENPNVGCVSPKIYFAKGFEFHKDLYEARELGRVIWYAGGKLDWANMLASHRGVDEVDFEQYDEPIETDFMSGCCVLIRSSVLKEVEGFDEKFFLYWEDTDLSQRIKLAGWQVSYFSKAFIWHKNAGSSSVGSKLHNYFLTRNRLLFGFRYASFRTKFALIRQSLGQLWTSDTWTQMGVRDFFLRKFYKGSWR